jgi:hypothetical protein
MATGTGASGKTLSVGPVTILGTVTAISGTGASASVTIQPISGGSTFTALASDCYAPKASGAAQGKAGAVFDVGSRVTVPALCTAISGSGATATLTSTLNSGTSVTHPSTSAQHPHSN